MPPEAATTVPDNETGKVDYREKAAHESVTKGMLLGHQVPAEKGKNGLDVYGKLVPAEEPEIYYPTVVKTYVLTQIKTTTMPKVAGVSGWSMMFYL